MALSLCLSCCLLTLTKIPTCWWNFVLIVKFCQGHSELPVTKRAKGVAGEVLVRAKPCALVVPQDDFHLQEAPCC